MRRQANAFAGGGSIRKRRKQVIKPLRRRQYVILKMLERRMRGQN
jgi:hypothetical protein